MNGQRTTSAALYFEPRSGQSLSLHWLERSEEFFEEHDLSPVLFTASGSAFLLDDCHLLAEEGENILEWDEVIVGRRGELIQALQNRTIESLGLDSPRPGAADREDWRAMVDVSLLGATQYVGIDDCLVAAPSALLCRAWRIAKDIFDVRYGIAYKSPRAEYPDGYARGFVRTSAADVFELIRHRDDSQRSTGTTDDHWRDELVGERRHLTGLFRGAYPANVLSEAHVRNADLTSCTVGTLTELGASLWLWELSDTELAPAEAMLESRGLLVSQPRG